MYVEGRLNTISAKIQSTLLDGTEDSCSDVSNLANIVTWKLAASRCDGLVMVLCLYFVAVAIVRQARRRGALHKRAKELFETCKCDDRDQCTQTTSGDC